MMPASHAADRYLQTRVQSSQPLELVVMLYDAALRSAATAREASIKKDFFARRAAVSKMLAIVSELQNMLDMERGGQIAADLDRLYTWMTEQLIQATIKPDTRVIDELRRVLEILRDGWQQIAAGSPGIVTP
jgi:flagellar secretion chaperone FliS